MNDATGVDRVAVALADWHEAWGAFAVAVRYHYRGRDGEDVRRALLRPYEQQAEEERAALRRRAKRNDGPGGEVEEPAV
ncbi:MAG TPA: hypothetical protein VFS43_29805 [Polyangiaceae bacterium]|nr:hypothetical protein [Polyangiaceae bacterium]